MSVNKLLKNQDVFKLLTQLGLEYSHPSEEYRPELGRPSIIALLNKGGGPDGQDTYFSLFGKQYQVFEKLMNLLLKEPYAQHLRPKDARDVLLDYCRDLINSVGANTTKADLENEAEAFLLQLLLQEQEWLVISPIDGLSLESERLTITDREIKKFDCEDITKFAGKVDIWFLNTIDQVCGGKVCIFVHVRAIDQKRAIEKGGKKINQTLHMIRGYFGSNVFYYLPTPTVLIAIKKDSGNTMVSYPDVQLEKIHIETKMQSNLLSQISCFTNFLNGNVPDKITKNALRAIRWLGSAVQDKELEDKLIKCFFALETLFVPEEEGRKGERLAFRIPLFFLRIDDEYYHLHNPDVLYDLYEKRSKIVHGGDIEKESITENDTKYLESLTWKAIIGVCDIVRDHREISCASKLRDWIERKDEQRDNIEKFIVRHCNQELKDFVALT